ncbi:MAG: dTMP kinase [Candidatus Diapherotrites archaeon]|nr:dTMP kinase [Candidatus Diapherotrites archaeon]
MEGKFIVFEGVDGSGKSLMARMAKEYILEEKGYSLDKVVLTQEPTNSFFGRQARDLQKTDKNPLKNAEKCFDLYVKDRLNHLRYLIEPALQMNKIVLCDRYKYSTFVYQSLQGINEKKIIEMHETMRIPDLILVFDVRARIALERIGNRGTLEKFEEKEFMEKVSRGFSGIKIHFKKENIKIIDAEKPAEKVFEEVKKELKQII